MTNNFTNIPVHITYKTPQGYKNIALKTTKEQIIGGNYCNVYHNSSLIIEASSWRLDRYSGLYMSEHYIPLFVPDMNYNLNYNLDLGFFSTEDKIQYENFKKIGNVVYEGGTLKFIAYNPPTIDLSIMIDIFY